MPISRVTSLLGGDTDLADSSFNFVFLPSFLFIIYLCVFIFPLHF